MAISVRWLTEDDWQVLRDVRLRALRDSPSSFTSTAERESAYDEDMWRARTANTVVAFEGGAAAGLACSIIDEDGRAQLVAMWVAPEARGNGAATAIVDAIAGKAEADGLSLGLCVYVDNGRAKRFYERYGFVAGEEMCDITGNRTMLQMTLLHGPQRRSGN